MATFYLPVLRVVLRALAASKVRNLELTRSLEAEQTERTTERTDLEAEVATSEEVRERVLVPRLEMMVLLRID